MTLSGGCEIDPRDAIFDSNVPIEQRIALCQKYLAIEPTRRLERQLATLLEEQQRQQDQEPTG